MAEVVVVGFKKDMYRASEALNMIEDMNNSWMVDLNDAVAVYRDYDGKLRVDQSYQMTTGQGAAWGGLFGGLIGALVAAPFTAGLSVAGATAAGTWKEDYGISEDFVQSVSAMLQPLDSAVFVLVRTVNPDRVAEAF